MLFLFFVNNPELSEFFRQVETEIRGLSFLGYADLTPKSNAKPPFIFP